MTTPLDQPELYPRLDPSRLRDRMAGLPDQCWQAWQEGSAFHLPTTCAEAQTVVLMGMGGSAIGGDLIAGLAALENSPSVTVLRNYRVPSWVGPTTLAIASSYSGNTEETIAMYRHARERGACLVVITS
ncbi:MAG: bifunctional phosphoglucose/phosphomannose isomerase, partial [Chloroflexota bacterium]